VNLDFFLSKKVPKFSLVFFCVKAQYITKIYVNNYNVEDGSKKIVKTFFWFISFSLIILATISLLVFELGVN
jgi:hypothetical protein